MIYFTVPAGLNAGAYDALPLDGISEWATSFGVDSITFDGTGFALSPGERGGIELNSTCLSTRLAYATAEARGISYPIPFTPVLVEVPTALEPPRPGLGSVSVASNQVSLGLTNLWTNYHYTVEQSVDLAGWTAAGSFWALGSSTNWTAAAPHQRPRPILPPPLAVTCAPPCSLDASGCLLAAAPFPSPPLEERARERRHFRRATQPFMAALSIQLRRSRGAFCPASFPASRRVGERNDCCPPFSSSAGSPCAAAGRARSPTRHLPDYCTTDDSRSAAPQYPRLPEIVLARRHVPAAGATRVQTRPVQRPAELRDNRSQESIR